MWNFLLRYQGVNIRSKYDSWNVDSAGVASLAVTGEAFVSFPIYENLSKPINNSDLYYQLKLSYTGPARRAGESIMLKNATNPLQRPGRAGSTCRPSAGSNRFRSWPTTLRPRYRPCTRTVRLDAGGQARNDRAL